MLVCSQVSVIESEGVRETGVERSSRVRLRECDVRVGKGNLP